MAGFAIYLGLILSVWWAMWLSKEDGLDYFSKELLRPIREAFVIGGLVALSAELGGSLPPLEGNKLKKSFACYWSIVVGGLLVAALAGSQMSNVYCWGHQTVHKKPGYYTAAAIIGKVLYVLGPVATLVLMGYIIKERYALAKQQTPESIAALKQDVLDIQNEIGTCQTLEQYNAIKEKIEQLVLKPIEVASIKNDASVSSDGGAQAIVDAHSPETGIVAGI